MKIINIKTDKKQFWDLLLIADDQGLKSVCVVTQETHTACELKNLATYEKYQHQGYGRAMVNYVCSYYKQKYDTVFVGTGDNQNTLAFYERCGFVRCPIVKNFFIDHYKKPIIENGKYLIDMIYMKRSL